MGPGSEGAEICEEQAVQDQLLSWLGYKRLEIWGMYGHQKHNGNQLGDWTICFCNHKTGS